MALEALPPAGPGEGLLHGRRLPIPGEARRAGRDVQARRDASDYGALRQVEHHRCAGARPRRIVSGAPDIAKVELTADDGKSWKTAELGREHDPHAWRLWSLSWTPKSPGKVRLAARATDSRGSVQPREAVWNQSGYLWNGWHSVEIEVTG
ncbi:MAG: hypothetical protein DMF54_03845 [Acidobacteria bacterium]|nr:MAG: hypothetical protein DMF54_03845 [Acidobacteriota bacterium]